MYDRYSLERGMNNMLTSVKNEKVKNWRKLKKKKERDHKGQFIIEGFHLIEEADKGDWQIAEIIYQEGVDIQEEWHKYPLYEVADHVMAAVSDTQTPQGIIAVVNKKMVKPGESKRLLLIDQVQDPGNLGTMIRTADAAGFDTVILGKGTVDIFNQKVLRATQGSIFHLHVYESELESEIIQLQEAGVTVWSTGLDHAVPYHELPIPERVAIIVGNEGAGVDPVLMNKASANVMIPIYGKAESLNVGIAAAILMYHVIPKR